MIDESYRGNHGGFLKLIGTLSVRMYNVHDVTSACGLAAITRGS